MNNPQENHQYDYPDNFIKTYKYEWWSFIFFNLFYQFLKVSNFFFLLNAVYSLIPDVSPFSPIVSIAPLLFVVGVAMIKDGVEDIYRHIADAEANSIVAHVVRRLTVDEREKVLEKERKEEEEKKLKHQQQQQNSSSPAPPQQQQHQQPYYKTLNLETKVMEKGPEGEDVEVYYRLVDVQSRDVQVGDIMMIKNGEEIRADVLLLSSTGSEGSSFIETCNLDGETNLKNRKAVPETWFIKDVESAVRVTKSLKIKTTEPSPHLLHWGGVMTIEKNDEDVSESNNNQQQQQEISLGLEQFLYRSSVLKNTELAWGVVLYAGVDTKMFRNLEDRPPKRSNLDVKLNWLIFGVIVVQHILLFFQAGFAVYFNNQVLRDGGHWYAKAYVERESSGSAGDNFVLWGRRYLAYFILMSYMIPISLFVTIELCKVAQAKLMEWDHEMYEWMHGKWQHCTANTSNLNEQLSQVKFIFSDKTGTLTENVMRYKLGDALGVPVDSDDWNLSLRHISNPSSSVNDDSRGHDELIPDFDRSSGGTSSSDSAKMQKYMMALALCHTVQPFIDEDSPSGIKYDGPSPDELALVETAKIHGFELRDRLTRTIRLQISSSSNTNNTNQPGSGGVVENIHGGSIRNEDEHLFDGSKTTQPPTSPLRPATQQQQSQQQNLTDFEILATLEFTPDRKMMSIVVRNPLNGKIELYTKGADSFVMERLSNENRINSEDDIVHTVDRLKAMASTGLRTLMVCYREISMQEFTAWNQRFIEAGKALRDRSKIVDKVCLELEKNLQLIGVTAIEDKLQDQVPETIRFMLNAGIIVWMLTGDKRETALTIAETSRLANSKKDYIDHIDIGSLKINDPQAVDVVREQLEVVKAHIKEREEIKQNNKKKNNNDNAADASGSIEKTLDECDEDSSDDEEEEVVGYNDDDGEDDEEMKQQTSSQQQQQKQKPKKVTFVIDGPALSIAMSDALAHLFIEVSMKVNSAVCCRLTPLQKASVVKMFQTTTGTTALAIGDGANDVSMISEGRVGVGIVGLEGAQAALAADYAIPRFKHLRRLLAVHGRYALVRNALCIIFSFYKNFLISTTLALYTFYSGLSGISIYDGWLLTMYNIILTSLPPGSVGFFEKDAPEILLEQNPSLYKKLSHGLYFSSGQLALWFSEAVIHGIVIFYLFFPMLQEQDVGGSEGRKSNYIAVSTIMNSVIVFMVLSKLSIHIRYWQIMHVLAFAASIVIYFAFLAIYSGFEIQDGSSVFHGVSDLIWNEPKFWLYSILACFGILGVDAGVVSLDRHVFHPSLINKDEEQVENACAKMKDSTNNHGGVDKDLDNADSAALEAEEERRARLEASSGDSGMRNILAVVPPSHLMTSTSGESTISNSRRNRSDSNSFNHNHHHNQSNNHNFGANSFNNTSNNHPHNASTTSGSGIVTNQRLQRQNSSVSSSSKAVTPTSSASPNVNASHHQPSQLASSPFQQQHPQQPPQKQQQEQQQQSDLDYTANAVIMHGDDTPNRVSPAPGYIASANSTFAGADASKLRNEIQEMNSKNDQNQNTSEGKRDQDGFPTGDSVRE